MAQTMEKRTEETAVSLSRSNKRILTPFRIVLLSIIALFMAALVTTAVIALTYDSVYPNLSAFGVSLGGLSREEAAAALSAELVSAYEDASVSLSLDGEELVITAQEAGVSLTSDKTANAAYDAGRKGNVFSRLSFAVSSLFTERNVEEESDFTIDRQAILNAVTAFCERLAKPVEEYAWEIGKDSIVINGGVAGARSDPEFITDAIIQAFRMMDFSPLSFLSEAIEPSPLPLETLLQLISVDPVPATVALDDTRKAKLLPHVDGVSFDMQKAEEALASRKPFTISLVYTTPTPTLAQLEETLFRDMLGEYETGTATSSANRVNNIVRTAELINGVILLPGEKFSFNDIVGRRTEERGFLMAGAYINGQLSEDIGGGVCQSSSTIYNAALLANLKIVNRQNHSMTVGYVPIGRDATVDYGNIDFAFENDTGYPIRIEMTHANSRLNVKIFGTKTDDLTVTILVDQLSYTKQEYLTEMNPALAPGEKRTKQDGHDGIVVQSYRVLTDANGKEAYRNPEAKSTYRKVNHITEVGPGAPSDLPDVPTGDTPTPTPTPPPTPPPSPPPEEPLDPSPSENPPDPTPPFDPADGSTYYPPPPSPTPDPEPSPNVDPAPNPDPTPNNEGEPIDDI